MTTISPSETRVIRRVTVEATGGHRELQAIATAVADAVEKLRWEASREYSEHFIPNVSTRPPAFIAAAINLEGTIKVETEDAL